MEIAFQELQKKDYKKAIAFAVKGMHCDRYFGSRFLSGTYVRYLLYSGMIKATQMIAAYDGDRFLGLLLSCINGEETCFHSLAPKLYVHAVNTIAGAFSRVGANEYGTACQEMFSNYTKREQPDGEITFLSVDPAEEGKGIGTALLREYERRERGKLIYLYTDDQCTWQFYDHRGFERVGEKDIMMDSKNKIPLKCMLYSKRIR